MIVDSSALVAIVLAEPDAALLLAKLVQAPKVKLSAATHFEASMVLLARGGDRKVDVLDALLVRLRVRVVALDQAQAVMARSAFDRYGKGRHPAGLNFGDCFSYALAKQTGEPLLFKGDDFAQTDLVRA